MKKVVVFVLFAALLPASLEAQRRSDNSFSFSPYVGAYKDAYDLEADGSDLGWMIGFKAGYEFTSRIRAFANLGYAEVNDVATRAFLAPIIDNEWILLTLGGEFGIVPGATSINLGLEAGVGWRRTTSEDDENDATDGWGSYETVIPTLSVRHQFSPRGALFVTAGDMIMDFLEGSAEHSPALTLGLSFR
jgi:hypothetical protein